MRHFALRGQIGIIWPHRARSLRIGQKKIYLIPRPFVLPQMTIIDALISREYIRTVMSSQYRAELETSLAGLFRGFSLAKIDFACFARPAPCRSVSARNDIIAWSQRM